MTKHSCCHGVYRAHAWRPSRCSFKATVEVSGKWYCGVHDPAKKVAKEEARAAAWKYKQKMERPRWFANEMADVLRKIAVGHNDPRALAHAILAKIDKDD